jgi:hypothetical protein
MRVAFASAYVKDTQSFIFHLLFLPLDLLEQRSRFIFDLDLMN